MSIKPKINLKSEMGRCALTIAEKLQGKGYTAYFAGGCVRDHLMSKTPKDFDIATTATPDQVKQLFKKTIPIGKQFGVMIVVEGEGSFEVATFRKEGGYVDGRHPSEVSFSIPEEDAKRRDFTVNGLFYDPLTEKVIDYVNGVQAIQDKKIIAIGDPHRRFDEDKLRLLRAIRFASNLGFEIEEETWAAVKEKAALIHQVSAERIRDELIKIFTRRGAKRGYYLLSESGLMKEVLPEIDAMKGVEQQPDYHPEGDVFLHTGLLLDMLENPSVVLAFSALFHDVGKPSTFKVRKNRITFYEHAPIGAEMTRKIMRRLRFSNDEIEAVSNCVANHMKFSDVQKMREGKLKRFMARETFGVELELHRIDCESSHKMLDNHVFLQNKLKEFKEEELKPKPFLTGHDVMGVGLKPGPKIKQVLDQAYDLQLEQKLKSREEALKWLKKEYA